MKFMMILSDPEIARHVCAVEGVEPFVDLEVMGKVERQGHMSSWKSAQTLDDVTVIREAVPEAHLIVRINPLHDRSAREIDEVVARGADSVMLPMFHDAQTLEQFIDLLRGRARALPLFETAASVAAIPVLAPVLGLERLHIGLNDLRLDLGKDFLFEPLADASLEAPAAALCKADVAFGIGGIARAREGIVSPEYLLGEHVRLGSQAVILSQTFHRNAATLDELRAAMDFAEELDRLRTIYWEFRAMDSAGLEKNRVETRDRINDVVALVRARKARP